MIVAVNHVSKVSSGFDYSLLTFACRSGIAFFLVGMDAESNPASNGITFIGGHRPKMGGLGPNTQISEKNLVGRRGRYSLVDLG